MTDSLKRHSILRNYAVVTLFPGMFDALTQNGISGRAFREGLCTLDCVNPRSFATDRHGSVDDKPYGGGPGMVMSYPPLAAAINSAQQVLSERVAEPTTAVPVVLLSPQGRPLDQAGVARLAQQERMILVCGRYEGIDERVVEDFVDEEVSVGDYVVSGGELPAMLLMDAMIRLLPGALGDSESAEQDSFAGAGLLDCPHYTRPEQVSGRGGEMPVPEVLLNGNHAAISRWRMQQSLQRTAERRPELLGQLLGQGKLSAEQLKQLESLGLLESLRGESTD